MDEFATIFRNNATTGVLTSPSVETSVNGELPRENQARDLEVRTQKPRQSADESEEAWISRRRREMTELREKKLEEAKLREREFDQILMLAELEDEETKSKQNSIKVTSKEGAKGTSRPNLPAGLSNMSSRAPSLDSAAMQDEIVQRIKKSSVNQSDLVTVQDPRLKKLMLILALLLPASIAEQIGRIKWRNTLTSVDGLLKTIKSIVRPETFHEIEKRLEEEDE